ncbi:MAG: hypothetical protein MUO26_04525 [Methanotrichaceae archaeon]|nr:hypothetical protein [Methanotrichaceae archaeon]
MNIPKSLATIFILLVIVMPALGEMADYQKGVMDGLEAGLRMGRLFGASQYDSSQAQMYNEQVNNFNQGIAKIFAGNQTAIERFWMMPLSAYGSYTPGTIARKPVHALDASFNQTNIVLGDVESGNIGRIYDWPISAYETTYGVRKNAPTLAYEQALPGV